MYRSIIHHSSLIINVIRMIVINKNQTESFIKDYLKHYHECLYIKEDYAYLGKCI